MEVVKQEMARVSIDILGISELKWTETGEFNSDEHYIYYCGQKSLRRNGVILRRQKSMKCSTRVQPQKWENDLVHFQGKPFNITVILVYAATTTAEGDQFYKHIQNLLELTPKKDVLSIIGHCDAKVGRQEIPGVAGKFGLRVQTKAAQGLTKFCQENTQDSSKHTLPTTKESTLHTEITRWSTLKSDWFYSLQPKMKKVCRVSKNKTRSWLWFWSRAPNCKIQTWTEENRENL